MRPEWRGKQGPEKKTFYAKVRSLDSMKVLWKGSRGGGFKKINGII